ARFFASLQKPDWKGAARLRRARLGTAAIVRNRGEAPAARDAHPGTFGLQVSAGEDRRLVAPEGGGRGRAAVELVAVGSHDERIARVLLPRQHDQAHTKRSTLRGTPSFAPSRSSSASKASSSFTPS